MRLMALIAMAICLSGSALVAQENGSDFHLAVVPSVAATGGNRYVGASIDFALPHGPAGGVEGLIGQRNQHLAMLLIRTRGALTGKALTPFMGAGLGVLRTDDTEPIVAALLGFRFAPHPTFGFRGEARLLVETQSREAVPLFLAGLQIRI